MSYAIRDLTPIIPTGEVVEGYDIVKTIEKCGSQTGKTTSKITIAKSGVV